MSAKRKQSWPMNIGSSTLLVIFLVLCMFTFAAISLTTAKKDYKDAQSSAERSREYYTAANAAEEKLNALNQAAVHETDVSYSVTINDSQEIDIVLKWNQSTEKYDILSWTTVNTDEWNGSDSSQLIIPNS